MVKNHSFYAFLFFWCSTSFGAVTIQLDYTYDTNNFFSNTAARTALQAAADRWACALNSFGSVSLDTVPLNTAYDWRVKFFHPGSGAQVELSTATGSGNDAIVAATGPAAQIYGGFPSGLQQDVLTIFAGGRDLVSAGVGSAGVGGTFLVSLPAANNPSDRGYAPHAVAANNDLPVWGGSISFDNSGITWDYSLTSTGAGTDFYSIAVHEIGHALGLSTTGVEAFTQHVSVNSYTGPNAIAAVNTDNGTALTSLNLDGATNHWRDNNDTPVGGGHQSFIYGPCSPQLAGTVGLGTLQDLNLEPTANFSSSIERIELTNADIGALRDTWTAVPEPSAFLFLTLTLCGYGMKRRFSNPPT